MWLYLVLTLLSVIQPLPALDAQTSYANGKAPVIVRPASLDDCVKMAGGPLSRWKQAFGVCLTLLAKTSGFYSGSESGSGQGSAGQEQRLLPPATWPAADRRAPAPWAGGEDRARTQPQPQPQGGGDNSGQKLVVATTDARYRGLSDVDAAVTSVYAQQRRSERGVRETLPGGDYASDADDNESYSSDDGGDNPKQDDPLEALGGQNEKRAWKRNHASRSSSWPSAFRSALYRSRRQHSLSINSALVSLADMLMAKDRARERARHRAFHQQLLNLGR